MDPLEITDLIARPPVHQATAAAWLRATGQERAARLIEALPATDGVLDAEHCRLLLRGIHAELQRLGEERQLPQRVAADIAHLISSRLGQAEAVRRVIGVGCETGDVLRSALRGRTLLPGVGAGGNRLQRRPGPLAQPPPANPGGSAGGPPLSTR